MKIIMCIVFWTDNKPYSTRTRNAIYCWDQLKKLTEHLRKNNIDCDSKIYDFSTEKQIEDAIHIPFPNEEFRKSEKMNIAINDNKDYDYFMSFDADCFFLQEDYEILTNVISGLKPMDMITFDCAKLDEYITESIDKETTNWWFAYAGEKTKGPLTNGMKGGFGGVFIVDMKILFDIGAFNEDFKQWGGEDNEIISRIYLNYKEGDYNHIGIREIFPFHLPHFIDYENENYRKK